MFEPAITDRSPLNLTPGLNLTPRFAFYFRTLLSAMLPEQKWHTLREPLIRDIGFTSVDAEWEALRNSWGCRPSALPGLPHHHDRL